MKVKVKSQNDGIIIDFRRGIENLRELGYEVDCDIVRISNDPDNQDYTPVIHVRGGIDEPLVFIHDAVNPKISDDLHARVISEAQQLILKGILFGL